jgi:hypothetical protein
MRFPEGRLDTAGDWASRLLARKRTVDDESYRVRSRASLQAMVEDRFATPTTARRAERENAGPQASGSRKRARFAAGRVAGVRKPWGW